MRFGGACRGYALNTAFGKELGRRQREGLSFIPYCWGAYIISLGSNSEPWVEKRGMETVYLSDEIVQMPHVLVFFWTYFDISLDIVRQ